MEAVPHDWTGVETLLIDSVAAVPKVIGHFREHHIRHRTATTPDGARRVVSLRLPDSSYPERARDLGGDPCVGRLLFAAQYRLDILFRVLHVTAALSPDEEVEQLAVDVEEAFDRALYLRGNRPSM